MVRTIASLLLALLAGPVCADGLTQLVSYRSPVDDSPQAYGVYLPDGPAPAAGYPVVLHAHGYGWWVGTGFSPWQREWADAHGWILVQLNARGPNFYWGIGDIATREVVADLALRFGIDRRRVYITGGSMGGTGAFRQGVAHPDLIAAAVGVDGWTDFREWHWHWYARKDQRNDIEEFRRPLLEAASPLYSAERARWGDVFVVADGRDDTVYPEQGLNLAARLQELALAEPGSYDSGVTLNPDRGHGGGYDVAWIYNYFLGKAARPHCDSFRIATTVLEHGELYWARMEALHAQGEKAVLDCSARVDETGREVPDRGAGVADVITTNLDAFSLHLPLSPVADAATVRVHVDGIVAYEGPPSEVYFEATRDADDTVSGWVGVAATQRVAATTGAEPRGAEGTGLRKTPELTGPLGHAFLTPFTVCYGTVGPADDQRRQREEAMSFVNGWNGFLVHAPGLTALPEDEVSERDLQTRHLVVYGGLDTSRLLQRAHAIQPLPVEVSSDRIVVRDRVTGDREYRGRKFGAFSVYPNPLTGGQTYLVICRGRFATTADGKTRQGLEFDLEKLAWGYSDYVIFNTDLRDLPHVMNVNNKPPVTCYEAGYMVEAGYHDARWRPDRLATLTRVRRTKPAGVRLIHVATVTVTQSTESLPVFDHVDGEPPDPPRTPLSQPLPVATVKVVDADGNPVRQARVTGYWADSAQDSLSRPTLTSGLAYFPAPSGAGPSPRFIVLNVMATGAVYDFEADALEGSVWQEPAGVLALRPQPLQQRADQGFCVTVSAEVANTGPTATQVTAAFVPPHGRVATPAWERLLAAGERARVAFRWYPDPQCPGGEFTGMLQAVGAGRSVQRPVSFTFPPPRPLPVRFTALTGKDIAAGEAYEVKAGLLNTDPTRELTLRVGCTLVEAYRHLPVREVTLPPGGGAEVVWAPAAEESALDIGEYHARVTVLDVAGISEAAAFAVR